MTPELATVCVSKAMKVSTVANASLDSLVSQYAGHATVSWQVPTRIIVIAKDDASVMILDSAHARLVV